MRRRDFFYLGGGAAATLVPPPIPVNQVSPARRVRRAFVRFGVFVSIFAFIVVGADVLLEQLIGRASGFFIFGTVCLIAAACTTLFAIIAIIGLAISSALDDQPPAPAEEISSRQRETLTG